MNQYAAGNYDASYTTNREGFKVMFGVGQALGNAIVTQFNAVWMQLNSKILKINDKTTNMDTTPVLWKNTTYIPLRFLSEGIGATVFVNKDGRTQVPLRFIAELLSWEVKWAQKDGSITLTKSM